jgi:ArsR family transcriptional regulator
MKNQTIHQLSAQIAAPIEAIASPQRVAIVLAIGQGEACVCHLETVLGWRQDYISQHLMALRKAGILEDRREGRYVFYRLKNPAYLDLISASAEVCGFSLETTFIVGNAQKNLSCECPHCSPVLVPVEEIKSM